MFLAMLLDGWLVCCCADSNAAKMHKALEIKSPTSSKIRQLVQRLCDMYGEYTRCSIGDSDFVELVFKHEYRVQVIHHAAVCDLDEVLFVVANEYKPIYAMLASISPQQRHTWILLLQDYVYKQSLEWAYTTAWLDDTNPEQYIPSFREEAVSTLSHSIDRDTVVFHYSLWKSLL